MRHRLFTIQLILIFLLTQIAFGESLLESLSSALKTPEITYDRFEVKRIAFDKADVEFIFIVNNPNPLGLDNISADYELFLKGQSTAQGKGVKFAVKPNSKSEIRLPAEINYMKAFKSVEILTEAIVGGQKTIPFTLNTVFKIDVKVATFNIPVTARGDLPLPEFKVNSF
jgi:LEA14-like dessication related protein